MRTTSMFAVALALAPAAVMLPRGAQAQAQAISQEGKAGVYSVTLKVLPAESFAGPKAEMTRDGGAKANTVNGPMHPNHHVVVFIKRDNKPVESASVSIRYRMTGDSAGTWKAVPVARMHVAGKGLETTHFGNNIRLLPGNYVARVTVNRSRPALFHFTVAKPGMHAPRSRK